MPVYYVYINTDRKINRYIDERHGHLQVQGKQI